MSAVLIVSFLLHSCKGSPRANADASDGDGASAEPAVDAWDERPGEKGPGDLPPTDEPADGTDAADASDAGTRLPVFGRIALPPPQSVIPSYLESCPVYQETSCRQGTVRRCAIWDSNAGGWAENPDPWAEQIFWYDRYFDLYHRMEGQQSEFLYTRPMAPGTPESEWGRPENFERYEGYWDSSGWTGTALQAAAARYRTTGTQADYGRMMSLLATMMFMYDATGVPGLLMRCHYAMLEKGAPAPIGHPGKALVMHTPPENWEDHNLIPQQYLDNLPAYYTEGVEIGGKHYAVTAKWMGHSSRDMYVRSLPGILLAYDLLGAGPAEDALRDSVRRNIPCTLKRLKKMRIRNVQKNEEVRKAVAAYLGTGSLQLEPGDIDLTAVDTIYAYVLEEPHPAKPDLFDPTCPDTLPMEPDEAYDLDASDTGPFVFKFAEIMMRVAGQGDVPISWILFPSVRGSDVLFMTQWGLAGHYLTGDPRFLDFVKRLFDELDYWAVVNTMGSFRMPKWCRSYYGPSLAYPTYWNLQNRIAREEYPEFWYELGTAVKEEVRLKELAEENDPYFGVLYATMVDETIDPDVHAYVGRMVAMLAQTSQYPSTDPFEPRRSYNIDYISNPPPGLDVETVWLTQEEKDICLTSVEIFGLKIEGYLHDENPRAKEGLPIRYRIGGPFQWQEDPFMLKRDYGDRHGRTQWPMSCFSVAYWTARMQGTVTAGQGLGLAWQDTGQACVEDRGSAPRGH